MNIKDIKKPKLLSEFRKFISKGNVIDLAVGIIIGSAFTSIVNSLVKEVIMPPIGLLAGRVNFSDLRIILQSAGTDGAGKIIPEVSILYGNFLQAVLNFFIVALVVFALVKMITLLQKEEEKAVKTEKAPETELTVLKDIREKLSQKK